MNRTRYLLTADGSPVQLATSYEPAEVTAGTIVASPEEGPLAGRGVVERLRAIGVTVDQLTEDVSVRRCLAMEAAILRIPAGAPVLVVTREHRAGQRAVEMSEIVIPADRFTLRYRIPVGRAERSLPTPVRTAGGRAGRRARRSGPASMIRPAQAADIPAIHQMIMDLAAYERSRHEVSATEDDLRAALLAGPEAGGRAGSHRCSRMSPRKAARPWASRCGF